MNFLILLVVQAAMPGAIAEEERKSSALEMLQASDIRIPVEVDLGSTFEEINALSEKFKELESKFEASETKISGLKSEMTQMEEASEIKNSGLKSEIARMKEEQEQVGQELDERWIKISELESKIARVERKLCDSTWTASNHRTSYPKTCQIYADEKYCANGTYGSAWRKNSWGTFEDYADLEGRTALVCPECGCKGSFKCVQGSVNMHTEHRVMITFNVFTSKPTFAVAINTLGRDREIVLEWEVTSSTSAWILNKVANRYTYASGQSGHAYATYIACGY